MEILVLRNHLSLFPHNKPPNQHRKSPFSLAQERRLHIMVIVYYNQQYKQFNGIGPLT